MAERKEGTEGMDRREGGEAGRPMEAGRISVRRETLPYRRDIVEAHVSQVQGRIEAALARGRRLREDIVRRIDAAIDEEEQGKVIRLEAEAPHAQH